MKSVCNILKQEQIYNHAEMLAKYGHDNPITYSNIFKDVIANCKQRNLNPKDIVLGIFSCQDGINEYRPDYDIYNNVVPNVKDDIPKATIYNYNNYDKTRHLMSPTIIGFTPTMKQVNWTALVKSKHQGCALNVLSFYDIVKINEARESVTCLSLKGTSVFKIVDYIDNYVKTTLNVITLFLLNYTPIFICQVVLPI